MTKDYNVGGHAGAGIGGLSLSGYPVRTPVVDLVEIGAGGGSIAWVDSGGLLRVGPRSAGADPGPVCYRRGGTEPTVTDANVVLGRLNPDYFLGGEIGLDVEGARKRDRGALREAARPRRHEAAQRHRRDRERGDGQRAPPDLRAARLRPARLRPRRLRRRRPRARERDRARRRDADARSSRASPGHLLRDRPAHDRPEARRGGRRSCGGSTRSTKRRSSPPSAAWSATGAQSSRREGVASDAHRLPPPDRHALRRAELRAARFPAGDGAARAVPHRARPHLRLRRAVGAGRAREPAPGERRKDREAARRARSTGATHPARRNGDQVYFAEADGYVDCPIYDRYALPAGATLLGPAVVEEFDSTTVVHPGFAVSVDDTGNLIVERQNDAKGDTHAG